MGLVIVGEGILHRTSALAYTGHSFLDHVGGSYHLKAD